MINTGIDKDEYIYIVDSNGTYVNCFDGEYKISRRINFWEDLALGEIQNTTVAQSKEDFSTEEKRILVLFDFDNLKQINDTFGHAYGDQGNIKWRENR